MMKNQHTTELFFRFSNRNLQVFLFSLLFIYMKKISSSKSSNNDPFFKWQTYRFYSRLWLKITDYKTRKLKGNVYKVKKPRYIHSITNPNKHQRHPSRTDDLRPKVVLSCRLQEKIMVTYSTQIILF